MQCHASLKRPLRNIVKAIGTPAHAAQCSTIPAKPTTLHIDSNTAIDQSDRPCLRTRYGGIAAHISASGALPVQRNRPLDRSNTTRATGPACRRYATTAAAAVAYAPDTTSPSSDGNPGERSEDNHFEPMVEQAGNPALDITIGKPLTRLYHRKQCHHQLIKSKKKALAQERFKRQGPGLLLRIILTLDEASSSEGKDWGRRSSVYKLPPGVCASFVDVENAAVLEIMLRTKCHVQVQEGSKLENDLHSFTGLVLKGTPAEVRDALALIPKMIRISHNGKTVEEGSSDQYSLRSEELEDEGGLLLDDKEPAQSTPSESSSSSQAAHAPDKAVNDQTAQEKTTVSEEAEAMTGAQAAIERPSDIACTPFKPSAADHDAGPARSVWAEQRLRSPPDIAPLLNTDHTSIRTAADLQTYIGDLVARHPTLKLRTMPGVKLPDATKETFDPIRDKLVTLLTEPSMIPLITHQALQNAWQYLHKTENIACVRTIYSTLDQAGFKFTRTDFDARLQVAARRCDAHNFNYILGLMRGKRIQPGAETWAAAHDLVFRLAPKYSNGLIALMRDRGIFSNDMAVREVLKTTAEKQITAHLADGRDIKTFFEAQDKRMASTFGRPKFNWLQMHVVNSFLNVILSSGRTDAVRPLLDKFAKEGPNGGAPNVVTVNTLLTMAFRNRDPSAAVAILKWSQVGQPGAIVPDVRVYVILFSLAWHTRYYNMLRVIWRYTCVAGHADYILRQRIRNSILLYAPEIPGDMAKLQTTQLWQPWAGKFVTGIASDMQVPNALLVEYATQEKLERASAESKARFTALKNAFEADLREVGSLRPLEHLPDILERAYRKDREWKARALGVGQELKQKDLKIMFAEMLEDGIDVPMTAGDFSRETRTWAVPEEMAKHKRKKKDSTHSFPRGGLVVHT
ncbi:hypothetical protein AC578_6460 [Pseudocercospora eumusae]|uniref:Pentatricopeptide repeat protein n=1 Tax=Pseudocercospora eumusae TaxID=321146 RepID=A0A139HCZ1_9PEZI|nr:hypothetical protein AC578_6460 [Pseudocercospora eumusae]